MAVILDSTVFVSYIVCIHKTIYKSNSLKSNIRRPTDTY